MWAFVLLNVAYLIYAVSPIFKDMLALRVTLLAATVFFIAYGAVAWQDAWPVVVWNIPVGLIHGWQIWAIFRERHNVDLDDRAEAVRTLLYPGLGRVEFNALWHAGHERSVTDEVLIVEGEPVDELFLVIEGEVEANVSDEKIVRLGRLRFLGEISSLTGQQATATVRTIGTATLRVWDKQAHAQVCESNADIERAHLLAIGQDLTRKLS